jgi:hypothetical protein
MARAGPLLPFTCQPVAAVQLHQTGRSCVMQHFDGSNVGQQTKPTFGIER